jgi:hypothetical protein
MKNKLALTYSLIVLFASMNTAYAGGGSANSAKGGVYFGIDAGSTNTNIDESNFFTDGNCVNPVISCAYDDNDSAIRLSVGYNITPNFAVELSYADLGETAALNLSNSATQSLAVVRQDTTALSLSAIGKKQLGQSKFTAFGKVGLSYWDSEINFDRTPILAAFPNQTQSETGIDPIIGLGLEYKANSTLTLKAGWDRYYSVGERGQAIDMTNNNLKTVDTDIDMLYVGASVSF